MPRARLNTLEGKTTEWKNQALRAYQRRTLAAEPRNNAASCTENGGGGGDTGRGMLPHGTNMLSTSVTNRVCIAVGKVAKSASQY